MEEDFELVARPALFALVKELGEKLHENAQAMVLASATIKSDKREIRQLKKK